MTTAQRTAIASPVAGVFVYDTNLSAYVYWDGTQWVTIGSADDAGSVLWFAMSTPPAGFLKANGAAVSRTTYSRLFSKISTTWGAGDGSTTFNLPDLRGEFIRGWDDARGVDSGRAFASAQSSQNLSHTHSVTDPTHGHVPQIYGTNTGGAGTGGNPAVIPEGSGGNFNLGGAWKNIRSTDGAGSFRIVSSSTGISLVASGDTEARPRNISLLACIKF